MRKTKHASLSPDRPLGLTRARLFERRNPSSQWAQPLPKLCCHGCFCSRGIAERPSDDIERPDLGRRKLRAVLFIVGTSSRAAAPITRRAADRAVVSRYSFVSRPIPSLMPMAIRGLRRQRNAQRHAPSATPRWIGSRPAVLRFASTSRAPRSALPLWRARRARPASPVRRCSGPLRLPVRRLQPDFASSGK